MLSVRVQRVRELLKRQLGEIVRREVQLEHGGIITVNYVDYSGLKTSPFFLQPTRVDGVRTVNFSMGFSF